MKGFEAIFAVIKKEWHETYQQSHVFYSSVLYIFATVFLLFVCIGIPDDGVWNALFWITQVFISINAISKSFLSESQESLNYYYLLISPQQFICSKMIYNLFLSCLFVSISILLFLFFLGRPEIHLLQYFFLALLGGIGFSNIFTFLSAVSAKANQNAAFVAILGFPLIIPQIMLIDKLSDTIFSTAMTNTFYTTLGLLTLLDILNIILAIILYPFLWKE